VRDFTLFDLCLHGPISSSFSTHDFCCGTDEEIVFSVFAMSQTKLCLFSSTTIYICYPVVWKSFEFSEAGCHSILYIPSNFVSRANSNICYIQILETAFKKETVGLVTREQYVEKVIRQFLHTLVFASTIFNFPSNLSAIWSSRGLTSEPRSRRKRKRNFRSCNKSEFELCILACYSVRYKISMYSFP